MFCALKDSRFLNAWGVPDFSPSYVWTICHMEGHGGWVTLPQAVAFDFPCPPALCELVNRRFRSARCCAKCQRRNLRSDACACSVSSPFPRPLFNQYSTPLPSTAARKKTSFYPCIILLPGLRISHIIQHIFPAGAWHILISWHKSFIFSTVTKNTLYSPTSKAFTDPTS